MSLRIGIDVGGTFTDFLVTRPGEDPRIHKVLSTPADPSIGLLEGLRGIASGLGMSLAELGRSIDTIVHGTTVTTNAVLTRTGAATGLLTTRGVRDALEMRRGIREEQYDNRYRNVPPLVPRRLRAGVGGRLDPQGREIEPLSLEGVREAIRLFRTEGVEAIAICFMNSFASPEHEARAADLVRRELPGAYLTVSSELLPSIRFYNRVSTTVLNSYVGPKLDAYLERLASRLAEIGFGGVLLVMQSNGGVMSPEVARRMPALTLLSGPAAGPGAGVGYVRPHGRESCITVDMGGTSFDASLVRDGTPIVVTEGEINRYRTALPMLDIVTIGAGGGSIGWIDEGGLLRMGPASAGADPGPACYGKAGRDARPTCTDADLVLGYLDPDFFAGGAIPLDREAAERAIRDEVAAPLGLSLEEAAAGMYRVINTNMAQGVREVSVKRGFDPREFPLVVAGGAGPVHACPIARELEIPLLVVPRESSILCAAGMLMSDLLHDLVRSRVELLDRLDFAELEGIVEEMRREGEALLEAQHIPEERRRFVLRLDCRYARQYHEVTFDVPRETLRQPGGKGRESVAALFHEHHRRMYGYSLEEGAGGAGGAPIELINVRLRAVGLTDKPRYAEEPRAGADPSRACKSERRVYLPEEGAARAVPVFDGHRTRHGNRIPGPAVIEQVNTTIVVGASYDCVCDRHGSFVLYEKGSEGRLPPSLRELVS